MLDTAIWSKCEKVKVKKFQGTVSSDKAILNKNIIKLVIRLLGIFLISVNVILKINNP